MISAQAPFLRAMAMAILVCVEGLIEENRITPTLARSCVSELSPRANDVANYLISLLVASLEQIIVAIWVKHGSLQGGPITRLEPLMVLIMWHYGSFRS